jgi:hypothetical protein
MMDAGGGLSAWPEIEAQDLEEVQEIFEREAWGDGLPVIPPTPERVRRALDAVGRDPGESLGVIAPSMLLATVGSVAVNAVAAGCRPAYLPVVLAAVEAVADERFNLRSVQGTADDVAPLIVVNGPVRARIGLNAGPNVFGPGWRQRQHRARAAVRPHQHRPRGAGEGRPLDARPSRQVHLLHRRARGGIALAAAPR